MSIINVYPGVSAISGSSNQKASVKKADKGSEDGKYAVERAEPSSLKSTIIDAALGILLFPLGISGCTCNPPSPPPPPPTPEWKFKTPQELTKTEYENMIALFGHIYDISILTSPGTQFRIFGQDFSEDPETHQKLSGPIRLLGAGVAINYSDADIKKIKSSIYKLLDELPVGWDDETGKGVLGVNQAYVQVERKMFDNKPEVQFIIFPRMLQVQ